MKCIDCIKNNCPDCQKIKGMKKLVKGSNPETERFRSFSAPEYKGTNISKNQYLEILRNQKRHIS